MNKRPISTRGVGCMTCGSTQTPAIGSNYDEEGNRIRLRYCRDCQAYFTTVEIAIPGLSFHRAKSSRDRWQRMTREYVRVTQLPKSLKIEVIPSSPIKMCRRGLHEMEGENIGWNGRNRSKRYCRECKRQNAQLNYHHARQHAPESILEDQRRYWREQKRKQAA